MKHFQVWRRSILLVASLSLSSAGLIWGNWSASAKRTFSCQVWQWSVTGVSSQKNGSKNMVSLIIMFIFYWWIVKVRKTLLAANGKACMTMWQERIGEWRWDEKGRRGLRVWIIHSKIFSTLNIESFFFGQLNWIKLFLCRHRWDWIKMFGNVITGCKTIHVPAFRHNACFKLLPKWRK